MAGMFGNRYDTMSALDDALLNESFKVGQLNSYGVGQMAAYQEGVMGNPFAAAVNDLMSPEMQKQKILVFLNIIFKDEDIYCWQFSNKGYFNFKSNIIYR